jgi:DNA-binding response OmpR family regulator
LETEKKIQIVIVDDDLEICQLLCQYLDQQGFSVTSVNDGTALDSSLDNVQPDLIILDLMLPGENGLSILKRIQKQEDIPIIMLSASAEDVDRIIGLELGADDYLAKPFNPRELLARIRSVLRRQGDRKEDNFKKNSSIHSFGLYSFNITNQVLHRENEKITLTSGELSLLNIFVENPNHVLTRDTLLEKLKGYDCAPFDRSIDVRIMRLRQKIEIDTTKPKYILTVWGQGYKFVPGQPIA